MNLSDSIQALDALGPVTPPTPAQEDAMRRLVAGQPDAADLLAALGVKP